MKVDYLIVGQGLAGTLLAYHLIKAKNKLIIFDKYDANSSSRVAAGLFNPITGNRMVKTWKADSLFPYLSGFYKELEEYLDIEFFKESDIYRPFIDIEEQNDWGSKSSDPLYSAFISNVYIQSQFGSVHDSLGGIMIRKGGVVEITKMIDTARNKFKALDMLVEESFEPDEVETDGIKVRYHKIEADKLIFCSGFSDRKNRFFNWLPFRPVKGEVLHVKPDHPIDKIYNRGCFITPSAEGISKGGSTYDWKDLSATPTEKGRKIILEKLRKLIDIDVAVVNQKAGIRPATADRRPFIGIHPEYKTIAIFNGLGTKGVTLAPYFSNQFVGHLEYGANLDKEVDIKRYYSLYYKSIS